MSSLNQRLIFGANGRTIISEVSLGLASLDRLGVPVLYFTDRWGRHLVGWPKRKLESMGLRFRPDQPAFLVLFDNQRRATGDVCSESLIHLGLGSGAP